MTRKRKILTAGLILGLGLVLAWPFRRTDGDAFQIDDPVEAPNEVLRASNGDLIAANRPSLPTDNPASDQIVAHMASTHPTPWVDPLESFDLANHPALAGQDLQPHSPSVPPAADPALVATRPAYTIAVEHPAVVQPQDDWPRELVHIVANGDTLEKLAERYLNDSGRALEIFDLNRDQLSNPHLLPIGVELRMPVDPNRILD